MKALAWYRLLALLMTMFGAYGALAGTNGSRLDSTSNGCSLQAKQILILR